MDHLAIMKKTWNLIPKILSGDKKIESRWYIARYAPWDRINKGDTVYFKDAGAPVTAKAEVEKVIQHANYSDKELRDLLEKYGGSGNISFTSTPDVVFHWAQKRNYCILIFLKNPEAIKPFNINKTGYGNACAWICVNNINKLRIKS